MKYMDREDSERRRSCARCLFAVSIGCRVVMRLTGLPKTTLRRIAKSMPVRMTKAKAKRNIYTPKQRVLKNLKSRLQDKPGQSAAGAHALLGCSDEFLFLHIESQMEYGMGWHNYGEWHVDHVKPCSAFDLTDPHQKAECYHYTNLRPLWSWANRAKGWSAA